MNYCLLLNYMRANSLKRIFSSAFPKSYQTLASTSRTFFSSEKEKQSITFDDEELERIRNMFANKKMEDIEKGGENFFQGEETQLSLKVIQIDSVQLLRPIITQYANKKIDEMGQKKKEKEAELARCRFIVLFKYTNLGGKLTAKEIQSLYSGLSSTAHLLDEIFLTNFYRIIANELTGNPNLVLPPLPLLENPSHSSSELLALLLMVYPKSQDQIYIHYHLVSSKKRPSFREGVPDVEKDIVYDPVHLTHLLKFYFFYQDLQKLMKRAMTVDADKLEEGTWIVEDSVKSQIEMKERRIQAISLALAQGMHEVCNHYLFIEDERLTKDISFNQALLLLKGVLTAKKYENYDKIFFEKIIFKLLTPIIIKNNQIIPDSPEEQQAENTNYISAVSILTLLIRLHRNLFQKIEITQLMINLFHGGSWHIKWEEYNQQELFDILVCYKAARDIAYQSKVKLDSDNYLLLSILKNYRQEVDATPSVDIKHMYYVCFFAKWFGCVQIMRSTRIEQGLIELQNKKETSPQAKAEIQNIMLNWLKSE